MGTGYRPTQPESLFFQTRHASRTQIDKPALYSPRQELPYLFFTTAFHHSLVSANRADYFSIFRSLGGLERDQYDCGLRPRNQWGARLDL